jgi:lipocalin
MHYPSLAALLALVTLSWWSCSDAVPQQSVRTGHSAGYGEAHANKNKCLGSSDTSSKPSTTTTSNNSNANSEEFCQNPPTVPNLDLSKYANNMYYSLYLSGSARNLSGRCITANYSLNPNATVNVLNCQVLGPGRRRPSCVRAIGARRPGLEPSRLTVSFPGFRPTPFPYNVAAVLGAPEAGGYTAAAVYACGSAVPGATPDLPGFYILGRSVENRQAVLQQLKHKLKDLGYNVDVDFVPTDHTDCLYFNDPTGFDLGGRPPPGIPN